MTWELHLVVWLRNDTEPPTLIMDRAEARRLTEDGLPVTAYCPVGTGVGPAIASGIAPTPRPFLLGGKTDEHSDPNRTGWVDRLQGY